jgi:hypothetical protein
MIALLVECGGKRENFGGAKLDAEATPFAPFGGNRNKTFGHACLSGLLRIATAE